MIKKLLPVLIFVFGAIAVIGGGAYFYKQTFLKSTWTPIKDSTPQETFNTYLNAAYSHDGRAIKQISATNSEIAETNFFGAFSKCIETKPESKDIEGDNSLNQPEREPRVTEEKDKAIKEDDYDGGYDLSEDETVPVGVSGFVLSLNALNIPPKQIKITNSKVLEDEAIFTFVITDKYGNMPDDFEQKALFKKLGNEWKIFDVLSQKIESKNLNFAVQKSVCK